MNSLRQLPLGLYEKAISNHLSWEDKLRLTSASGFDFLEMGIDSTPERLLRLHSQDTAQQLRHAIETTGVPVRTMALTANREFPLGSEDPEVHTKALSIVEKAITFAAETGIRIIHLAGYDEHGTRSNANTKMIFQASIEHCVRRAAGAGVILAIETMDTSFMGSCANIISLCRQIDSPFLQCYADIGNLTASGIDVKKDLEIGGKHIVGVHLKDTRPGVYRDILFGDGIVDFDSCLDALQNIDYAGVLTAEMWSYDSENFHSYLSLASKFLREKLANH